MFFPSSGIVFLDRNTIPEEGCAVKREKLFLSLSGGKGGLL
jgi:hypothetical protein